MVSKKNSTYKSIGEVAEILNLIDKNTGKTMTHTIRFWENNLNKLDLKYFQVKEDIMMIIQLRC